jgi:predicted TIM-barrel fold metal-dependent hydrolase
VTDLAQHIRETALVDSHEHLAGEAVYLDTPPDVLQQMTDNYIQADLIVAGADPQAVEALQKPDPGRVAERFAAVREAWERCRHTGYGQAVRLVARQAFGIDELTPESLAEAQARLAAAHQPGERLRILKERGNLDHVQIDRGTIACEPDPSAPDFFLHDIHWDTWSCGEMQPEKLRERSSIEIRDLATLRSAIEAIFERYGRLAVAVKMPHAYDRTLAWQARDEADAERVLRKSLKSGELDEAEKLCLGDWSLARGVEQAMQYNLPVKIHTGYHAGHGSMIMDWIRPSHLCPLLKAYPKARFVLMHAGYPYGPELITLAKHFPNVYADLCWAWAMNPRITCEFVRHFIHAAPANKLFAFGGDTQWPHISVAYATQARLWLTRALQAEIDDGHLTEAEAIRLATDFMRENQYAVFDIERTRAALRAACSA